jgi:hypothetical protein
MNSAGNSPITLHWWNFGKKTLDFKGTINDYLKDKNFKVSTVRHPRSKDVYGFRFKFEVSGQVVTLDIYHQKYEVASIKAIQLFLTLLGDRALIQSVYKTLTVNA